MPTSSAESSRLAQSVSTNVTSGTQSSGINLMGFFLFLVINSNSTEFVSVYS